MSRKRPTAIYSFIAGVMRALRSGNHLVYKAGSDEDRKAMDAVELAFFGSETATIEELRQVQQNLINLIMEVELKLQRAGPGAVHAFGTEINGCAWMPTAEADHQHWGYIMSVLHDMNEAHTIFDDHGPEDSEPEEESKDDDVSIVERPGFPGLWHIPVGAAYMWQHKRQLPPGMKFLAANEEARAYMRQFDPYPDPDGPPERDFPGENPFYAPGDLERDKQIYPGIHPDA